MSVSRTVGDMNGAFQPKKNVQGKANSSKIEPKIIYACNKCSYKSSHKEELRAHKVDKHQVVLPPQIQVPKQPVVRKNEPKPNYACTQCSYLSADKDELRAHKVEKHQAAVQPQMQLPQKHQAAAVQPQMPLPKKPVNRKSDPKPSYACTECSFLSSDKDELRAHKATKHLASFKPDKNQLSRPAQIKNELNSSSFSGIKEAKTPTQVFACNKCSYKSMEKDELRNHKLAKHQVVIPTDTKPKLAPKPFSTRPSANQKQPTGNIWNMNKEDSVATNVFKTFKADGDASDQAKSQIKFSKDTPSASDAAELEDLAAELENSMTATNKDNESTEPKKSASASNEDYECKICMVTFWYKTQMETHFKDVHGTSEKKIETETEVYKAYAKSQSEQKNMTDQQLTSSRNVTNRSTDKSTTDYRRCCQLCNFSADREEFDIHLKSTQHIQKVENNSQMKSLNKMNEPRRNMSEGATKISSPENNEMIPKGASKRSLPIKEPESGASNKSLKLEPSNVQNQNLTVSKPANSEIKIIYACNKCSYKSAIKAELREHKVAKHEAVPLPQKPVIFTLPPLQNQAEDDDDSVDYSCKIGSCMQSFWYENDLYAHMANVHD